MWDMAMRSGMKDLTRVGILATLTVAYHNAGIDSIHFEIPDGGRSTTRPKSDE